MIYLKNNRFCILVLLLSCFACKQNKKVNIDVIDKYRLMGMDKYEKANFSFSSYIYPNENIKVWVNDQLIFDEVGDSNIAWSFYSFPFQINKIEIVSKYNNQIIFEKVYKDTLQYAKKIKLNLEMPIPKGRDLRTLTFPADWEHVEIDSAYRHLTLFEDTIDYMIY